MFNQITVEHEIRIENIYRMDEDLREGYIAALESLVEHLRQKDESGKYLFPLPRVISAQFVQDPLRDLRGRAILTGYKEKGQYERDEMTPRLLRREEDG